MTSSSVSMTSSSLVPGAQTGSGNPFLAQLAKKDKPVATTSFGENFTNPQPPAPQPPAQPQPPSYAAAVKGPGSVPSFIMHGPGSISLAPQLEEGKQEKTRCYAIENCFFSRSAKYGYGWFWPHPPINRPRPRPVVRGTAKDTPPQEHSGAHQQPPNSEETFLKVWRDHASGLPARQEICYCWLLHQSGSFAIFSYNLFSFFFLHFLFNFFSLLHLFLFFSLSFFQFFIFFSLSLFSTVFFCPFQ